MDAHEGENPSVKKEGPSLITVFVAMAGLAILAVHMEAAASHRAVRWSFFETLPFVLFWIHGTFFIRETMLRWVLIGYAVLAVLVLAYCLDNFWSGWFRCGNSFVHWIVFGHLVAVCMIAFDIVRCVVGVVKKKE